MAEHLVETTGADGRPEWKQEPEITVRWAFLAWDKPLVTLNEVTLGESRLTFWSERRPLVREVDRARQGHHPCERARG